MPNHFHWLFQVRHTELPVRTLDPDHPRLDKTRSLNDSIGILLRSYTRAINKQYDWTGSLFRDETKAKEGIINAFVTVDSRHWKKRDYIVYCFHYIHNNPVEAKLVTTPEEWEFSSARDYAGLRNGTLCDQKLGREILGH
jgi:putative transposase